MPDQEPAAEPLTLRRCWQRAAEHAGTARRFLEPDQDDYDRAAAHAGLAQAYATLLAAGVAAHPRESLVLRALTTAMYDPDEV